MKVVDKLANAALALLPWWWLTVVTEHQKRAGVHPKPRGGSQRGRRGMKVGGPNWCSG